MVFIQKFGRVKFLLLSLIVLGVIFWYVLNAKDVYVFSVHDYMFVIERNTIVIYFVYMMFFLAFLRFLVYFLLKKKKQNKK